MSLKLGKKPAKIDKRTLKLNYLMLDKKLPPIPETYDFDVEHKANIPYSMYDNDKVGDCVIATRADHTLRFEYEEQGKCVKITTKNVLDEYYSQQGYYGHKCWLLSLLMPKPDNGLILLESLGQWRRTGWNLDGNLYTIYAYASVDRKSHEEVKQAIYLLNGIQAGIQVPKSALDQFNSGKVWDVSNSDTIGGHCIYIKGYNEIGPICVTWANKKQMTWEFWDKYVDESYAIVDNKNKWMSNSILDVNLLDEYLRCITGCT